MTTRDETVTKRMSEVPQSAKNSLKMAYEGTGGRKNAVKAMCLHCTGFDRETVRNCTGFSCPLWAWRPFQAKTG